MMCSKANDKSKGSAFFYYYNNCRGKEKERKQLGETLDDYLQTTGCFLLDLSS